MTTFIDKCVVDIDQLPPKNNRRWKDDALCKGSPTGAFFPNVAKQPPISVREMCSACPVKANCLWEALPNDVLGIWAATTRATRDRIKTYLKNKGIRINLKKVPFEKFVTGCISDACRCPACRRAEYRRLEKEAKREAS